jgi:CCR4-NOT transcriptional regulation complex NOT5 subunit
MSRKPHNSREGKSKMFKFDKEFFISQIVSHISVFFEIQEEIESTKNMEHKRYLQGVLKTGLRDVKRYYNTLRTGDIV